MNNTISFVKAARLLVLKDLHKRHRDHVRHISTRDNDDKIKCYRVSLFNEDWGLYTVEAYKEWYKGLSLDELKTVTKEVEYVTTLDGVITIEDLNEEANNL